jgi:hypothetical protein
MEQRLESIDESLKELTKVVTQLNLNVEVRLTKVETNQGWIRIMLFGILSVLGSVGAFFSDKLFR